MKHNMKLQNNPFEMIKNGTKTIEMRLNDEKRKKLNIGDTIEFRNIITTETLETLIEDIKAYSTFKELYKNYSKEELGYSKDEIASPDDMEKYYSKEEQEKYGVLAIRIKVLKGKKN